MPVMQLGPDGPRLPSPFGQRRLARARTTATVHGGAGSRRAPIGGLTAAAASELGLRGGSRGGGVQGQNDNGPSDAGPVRNACAGAAIR